MTDPVFLKHRFSVKCHCCGASVASEQQYNQDLRRISILEYLKDSNAAAHSVDSDIFKVVVRKPARDPCFVPADLA